VIAGPCGKLFLNNPRLSRMLRNTRPDALSGLSSRPDSAVGFAISHDHLGDEYYCANLWEISGEGQGECSNARARKSDLAFPPEQKHGPSMC
jgi:hypothetical protein